MNMKMFNKGCKYEARPFKLPSLEGLAVRLRDLGGGGGGAGGGGGGAMGNQTGHSKLLLERRAPPPLTNTIRVAAQGHTYAFLRVPFGWHQAPGLVQALISDLLKDLGRGGVVVVQ